MKRRLSPKFIPNGDSEFAGRARNFAAQIAKDPSRYMLSAEAAEQITEAVTRFRDALRAMYDKASRSRITSLHKNRTRQDAEALVRKYANIIRANPEIDALDKFKVGIKERPTKLRERACPQTRPILTYMGSTNESGLTGKKHILRFREGTNPRTLTLNPRARARPEGVARVELFVELLAKGEDKPLPKHPGQLSGGRPWYLGSFTRNPIEVEFPVSEEAMLVVYWARWAGANCDVGPFSETCVAGTEGGFAWSKAITHRQLEQRRITPTIVTLRPPRELEYNDAERHLLEDHSAAIEPLPSEAMKQLPEAA